MTASKPQEQYERAKDLLEARSLEIEEITELWKSETDRADDLATSNQINQDALARMKEQLETLREALEWCNNHRDSERFHSVAESALNRVSSPATDRLGLDAVDAEFAAGGARPASKVFAELGLDDDEQSPASRRDSA